MLDQTVSEIYKEIKILTLMIRRTLKSGVTRYNKNPILGPSEKISL